jgi:hypothetical protein
MEWFKRLECLTCKNEGPEFKPQGCPYPIKKEWEKIFVKHNMINH